MADVSLICSTSAASCGAWKITKKVQIVGIRDNQSPMPGTLRSDGNWPCVSLSRDYGRQPRFVPLSRCAPVHPQGQSHWEEDWRKVLVRRPGRIRTRGRYNTQQSPDTHGGCRDQQVAVSTKGVYQGAISCAGGFSLSLRESPFGL